MISPNQPEFFIKKIDFMISKNWTCDITKSWRFFGTTIFFIYIYHKMDFLYKKNQVYFLISQNQICDIKNRLAYIKFDFVISQSGGFTVHTGLFQDFINNSL